MNPIYLDYNATTPLDPAVLEAMGPYLQSHFGNPSSSHAYGQAAHDAIEKARQQVADLIGAQADEIVFTGGGSEASNQAIKGMAFAKLRVALGRITTSGHVITCAVEHPATLQACEFLKRFGCRVTVLPVDGHGQVDPEAIATAIDRQTVLVSIMHANNEVGTLQPIRAIADVTRAQGVPLHIDAAQTAGKMAVNVDELGVEMMTMAGHKMYAPKGIGVLYIRHGLRPEPLIHGAGHEGGRRAGTENVPAIVGLGAAAEVARKSLPQATEKLRALRDRLWQRLQTGLGERVVLNGHPTERLPNTLNVNFVGHVGAELLEKVPEVAASTGSACHAGQVSLSPVLRAMNVPPELGRGAVRLSVGRFTKEEEIDRAAAALVRAAK